MRYLRILSRNSIGVFECKTPDLVLSYCAYKSGPCSTGSGSIKNSCDNFFGLYYRAMLPNVNITSILENLWSWAYSPGLQFPQNSYPMDSLQLLSGNHFLVNCILHP